MRIVHFSDFHGSFLERDDAPPLKGDVYVCTGDMLSNNPLIVVRENATQQELLVTYEQWCVMSAQGGWTALGRRIVKEREVAYQTAWLEKWHDVHGLSFRRDVLGIDENVPIICLRGNHDFIDLEPLFGGHVYEIHEPTDEPIQFMGVRFGGMRGINRIADEWSDEMSKPDLDDRCRCLPLDLDVLVTHAPPKGILDYSGDHYGVEGLAFYTQRSSVKLHLFGHIHEQGGKIEDFDCGLPFHEERTVRFSNAATRFNVIDL